MTRRNRISSLTLAHLCPQAPILGELYGASRDAVCGTAFHAAVAGQDSEVAFSALTPEEAADVACWHWPRDLDIGIEDVPLLQIEDAYREHRVALDALGRYCLPDSDDYVTQGTLDLGWVLDLPTGRMAVVVDIKRSIYTADLDGNLQLAGYGFAFAHEQACEWLVTGIWGAVEGEFRVSPPLDLMSDEAVETLRRVLFAASHEGRAVTGSHCHGCYGRLHCQEHLMPAAITASAGAHMPSDGGPIAAEGALDCLVKAQALEDLASALREHARAWAKRYGGIPSEDGGKVWAAVETKGRQTFDRDRFVRDHGPEVFASYQKPGKPFDQFRWIVPKRTPK